MLDWLRGRQVSLEEALEHHRAGRLNEAAAAYKGLLARDPGHIDALHFSGVVAYQQGRHAEAAALISSALARNPAQAPAHNNLGNVYTAQKRLPDAIACYRKAVELDPQYVDARVNLAARLKAGGELDEAARHYKQALALSPNHAMALSNLGSIHNDQARPLEAIECCRRAVAIRPELAEAHNNLGNALAAIGERPEAESAFKRALALKPDMAPASLNLAFQLLLRGDYAQGLPLLEKRFEASVSLPVHFGLRNLVEELDEDARWDGGPGKGRTLLAWSDQGLGDSLMTMRYLPRLKERGFARVVVYTEKPLLRAFRAMPGVDEVVDKSSPAPQGYDLHCALMSLPLAFGTRVDSIPSKPYFPVPASLAEAWARRIAGLKGRKVGLAWAGTAMNPKNAVRSVRLEALAPILKAPGVSFVSLQKGDGQDEIAAGGWPLADWMNECSDFVDTAALVSGLDLVICVDTAVAHLAGALGKPVWMLNRYESEWRWMIGREDSPWYPSMRIFTQGAPGDWRTPIERIAAALGG